MADLPLEEAPPVMEAAARHDLGVVLFAAPTTTDARLAEIAAADAVFIYAVADMGVTGERVGASSRASELGERLRSLTDRPVVMGVGISTPDQARAAAVHADGVIVGSALVRRALDPGDPVQEIATAVREFAEALARGAGAAA